MHTFAVDLALQTAYLVKLECTLTTVNNEEEASGNKAGAHEAEAHFHQTIEECFHYL